MDSTTARMHSEDSSDSEQYWSADEGPRAGGEEQRKSGGNRGSQGEGRETSRDERKRKEERTKSNQGSRDEREHQQDQRPKEEKSQLILDSLENKKVREVNFEKGTPLEAVVTLSEPTEDAQTEKHNPVVETGKPQDQREVSRMEQRTEAPPPTQRDTHPSSPSSSSSAAVSQRPSEEEERAPIPPPRRKRKKKHFKKQASLDDLEQASNAPLQRSMTIGSVSMQHESTSPSPTSSPRSRTPSHSSTPRDKESPSPQLWSPTQTHSPEPSARETSRERKVMHQKSAKGPTSKSPIPVSQVRLKSGQEGRPELVRAATPGISIEPNTSLELTEDLFHDGEKEVVTAATDTPLAKGRGSNAGDGGVIIPSDDESLDGDMVFGAEEEEGGGEVGEEDVDSGKGEARKERVKGGEKEKKESRLTSSPSDNQILASTMIKNLDTGEVIPLSAADERIPRGWGLSPLSEHLIRRTNALAGGDGRLLDDDMELGDDPQHRRKPHFKMKRLKFWGKRRDKEGVTASDDEMFPDKDREHNQHTLKYKPSSHYKGPLEFEKVRLKQDLTGHHLGAVWVMEFSICGRLLATAGQDSVVRVWVLRTASQFFHELQAKYQRFGVHSSGDSLSEKASVASTGSSKSSDPDDESGVPKLPFLEHPLCSYYGHTADLLDLSWSKNFFLLSSSMDKTVRLWHISRKECLCCFQHVDFVTAIAFHPRDDRYFLSGSLDGKLRLWNIPDKKVALWNEIEGVGSHLITAANFCMNGKLAVVGTYDGRCIFYETEHLKYHTQIQVRSRHGKNKGRKISGVEPLPGEDKLLVTSNDSRIRLYNLRDHSLSCKYRGALNTSSQINATFSRDGQYIISSSEDHYVYIWKTHHDVSKLSSARRDRNEYYESFSSHSAPVTAAIFAPVPGIAVDEGLKEVGHMIVAADYQGCIKVYVNTENL